MPQLEEVKKKLESLRMEELRLEAENFERHLTPILKEAIGRTYAYRNNSSGGKERWDVFRKLKAVEFTEYNAWAIYEECSIRLDNCTPELTIDIELIHRDLRTFPRPDTGWIECEHQQFDECKIKVLEQLDNPTMAREYVKRTY